MASIRLSEAELIALAGLPHLSIVLYVLGIRPRMDFTNGTVGARPLISWQALRESIYVEPHQGIAHEYASMQALRRAAGWLEKAGLIRSRSHDRQLIFFLPLAHADYSVRKKADRGPTEQADRGPTEQNPHGMGLSRDFPQPSRQTETEKADSHPVSGKPIKTSPPTPHGSGLANDGAGEGEESILIFPNSTTSQQKAAMAKKIEGLGVDMQQAVLDELVGCMQAGGVKNLPGLTRHFAEQARNGDFMPDKGVAVRAARLARIEEERRRQDYERRATEQAQQAGRAPAKRGRLVDLLKPGRAAA